MTAYKYMRQRIQTLLASCPNLERLIITNEPLEYDRHCLGSAVTLDYDSGPLWRAPRLLEIYGIDPFIASVKNYPKRRPRTYGYEVVLSILNYLPMFTPINLVIDYEYTHQLDGHALMTWDFKDGFPARCHPQLQATAKTMFGHHLDGQVDIPQILRCFLMGVTFRNGEDVYRSMAKQLYRCLENTALYKVTFKRMSYFPSHIPTLTHLVVQFSSLNQYLYNFIFRQRHTLEDVAFIYCRYSHQGWDVFLDLLGWLPKLHTVELYRCMVGSSGYSSSSQDCGFDLDFESEGDAGGFV